MTYNPRTAFLTRRLPPVIRSESIETLLAARRAAYLTRNPEWIDDPSDPASEPINAVADLEWRVMQRFNTGVVQLSAATAEGGNLDVLANNVGLARQDGESDGRLRQRVAAHLLSANIATLPALLAACLSQPGILDADAAHPENGQDFAVYVRSDPDEATAVADLQAWLNDDDRRLAGWSYAVTEAVATRVYATVAVTYDSNRVSEADLSPLVRESVTAYLRGVGINRPVTVNRILVAALLTGVVNAVVTLGTSAAPTTTADLPAIAGGYYNLQDDVDLTLTFADVT